MFCKMLTHNHQKVISPFFLKFAKWDIKMSEQADSDEISGDKSLLKTAAAPVIGR